MNADQKAARSGYTITRKLLPPSPRPVKRTELDKLVALADAMRVGEAVLLSNCQAQTFRVILAAQGFMCLTDGYRSDDKSKIWAFKLKPDYKFFQFQSTPTAEYIDAMTPFNVLPKQDHAQPTST